MKDVERAPARLREFAFVRGPGSDNMEVAALMLDTGERVSLVSRGSNPQDAPTGHLIYGIDGTLRAVVALA